MSLREDVSELKLRAEKQEHAKLDSELKYKSLQDAFTYLKAQLDDAEALLAIANKVISFSHFHILIVIYLTLYNFLESTIILRS